MIVAAFLYSIVYLIGLILAPIDALITNYLPALGTMLSNVGSFISLIFSYIGWAVSVSGIPTIMITVIITYYVFILTIPMAVYFIKLVIHWYHVLKP